MKINFNLTWKKILFVFLLIVILIYTYDYYSNPLFQDILREILKQVTDNSFSSNTSFNSISQVMLLFLLGLGFILPPLLFIYFIISFIPDTTEEIEIKQSTKKIEDKYKLIELERRLKRLREK